MQTQVTIMLKNGKIDKSESLSQARKKFEYKDMVKAKYVDDDVKYIEVKHTYDDEFVFDKNEKVKPLPKIQTFNTIDEFIKCNI